MAKVFLPHSNRHVGIDGEASGRPPDWRAAGLCRLRGGRLPDGSGAPETHAVNNLGNSMQYLFRVQHVVNNNGENQNEHKRK